ncbi:MAG: deoxyribose-phosphate aldolase [Spirochaetaceae bacterium]|nr:MAG: deoxyribose-phosphate aldolase [Spirochaetaceae bacterium]
MVKDINRYLDHAILKPEMTRAEVVEAIELGLRYAVYTVCVRPCDIPLAVGMCAGSTTGVSCVLAFPHGDTLSAVKSDEARRYIEAGANEIDMVVNYGYVKSGLWEAVTADIAAVTDVARPAGVPVKVIFETAQLSLDEIRKTTECSIDARADFVKTSTGFGGDGATEDGVRAMLETAAGRIKVKPSGGIRDRARAEMFIGMGVHRIGNGYNSTAAICGDTAATGDGY